MGRNSGNTVSTRKEKEPHKSTDYSVANTSTTGQKHTKNKTETLVTQTGLSE